MIITNYFLSTLVTAIGLSMDAFSLSILYGTISLDKKKMFLLAIVVGIFHFFMPYIGFHFGKTLFSIISFNPKILVSIIFFIISLQMYTSLNKKEELVSLQKLSSFLIFGLTVSLDSLSVGIGLGLLYENILLSCILFSTTSFLFTMFGLFLGKKLYDSFGKIATLIGSIILFGLSLYYFFF